MALGPIGGWGDQNKEIETTIICYQNLRLTLWYCGLQYTVTYPRLRAPSPIHLILHPSSLLQIPAGISSLTVWCDITSGCARIGGCQYGRATITIPINRAPTCTGTKWWVV